MSFFLRQFTNLQFWNYPLWDLLFTNSYLIPRIIARQWIISQFQSYFSVDRFWYFFRRVKKEIRLPADVPSIVSNFLFRTFEDCQSTKKQKDDAGLEPLRVVQSENV